MLDLIKVNKSFDEFKVLSDINISVEKGKFICILGPSGCGKTILLYLIAGFLKPTSGEILMENKPILKPDSNRMMVFQNYVLFPWKTIYENVLFALDNSTMNTTERREIVMRYLDIMGMVSFKDWYPYKLSGGMQQRVSLARALVTNPNLLLLDEPFSALDSQYRRFLRSNLEEIWQKTGKTIIFVTHSVNEAITLGDEIHLLSASPGTIRKVYQVNLARPRDSLNLEFIKLSKEIEMEMRKEFENITKNSLKEESLAHILKLSGRKGVL